MSIEQIKNIIAPIVAKYPLRYVGVFGSYAKGNETSESDIDLLIDYQKPFSLFDLVALEQEIEQASGKSVDMVTEPSLSPFIKDSVLSNLKIVYGQR